MTREQLNKWWAEIEAFKNGSDIEFASATDLGTEWSHTAEPSFSFDELYRVAPIKKWIIYNQNANKVHPDLLDSLDDAIRAINGCDYFHYMEIEIPVDNNTHSINLTLDQINILKNAPRELSNFIDTANKRYEDPNDCHDKQTCDELNEINKSIDNQIKV